MLKFLKSIFAKKEIEKEEIALNELENWFNQESKIIFNDLDKRLGEIKSKINQEIKKCIENLEILKNTELKNPNIPIRAKQAMEGNREAYIKRINIFLNNSYLNKTNYDEIIDFCNNFSNELNIVAKSTLKSYQILQEFLANESSNVAMNIKNLDNNIKELKNLIINSDLKDIEKIKSGIFDIKTKLNKKNNLKGELGKKQKSIVGMIKSKENLEEEINSFKKSQAFIDFQELKEKKESINKEIYIHKDILLHSFSVLEKSFKKFSRVVFEEEKLVKSYTFSPLKTLIGDTELKIIKILDNLEKNIIGNKLDLDEKKKQKSLNEIKKLNKDFFMDFLKKYKELEEKLDKINKELENNKTENKNIELNNKLNLSNSKIEGERENINNLKQESEKINTQELKTNLQGKINNTINKNIIIL